MKHTVSGEYQLFKKEKKKYRSWYFFFLFPIAFYVQYHFCIRPFLVTSDVVTFARDAQVANSDISAEQEALLAQAHAQSFTQDKLIALSDRAGEYDVNLTECSVQDRSEQSYLTKTTLFLKMDGDFEAIAEFLDSITSELLCSIDSLQMTATQESYQAALTLSCATVKA